MKQTPERSSTVKQPVGGQKRTNVKFKMPQRQKTEELDASQMGMLNQPSALEKAIPELTIQKETTQPVIEVSNSIVGGSAPDKEGANASQLGPDEETSVLIQSSLAVLRAAE